MDSIFKKDRNSKMCLNQVYFWTSTINSWNHLLAFDVHKEIIINCLATLTARERIRVYGFVIMPNHVHLLWEMLQMNGKEMPYSSFQKHTAHGFKEGLQMNHPDSLWRYKVEEKERLFRFWQRDPLAVQVSSREMAEQKLDYIHNNPLQAHWSLCQDPTEYYYSSISFYESGNSPFKFITDYRDRL